jgi:hypothetical protein
MNSVSEEQRRQELAQLQKLLSTITPPKLKMPVRRPSHVEMEEAKRKLMRATGSSRPNHQFGELSAGEGCVHCARDSLFRHSPADHLVIIQEEP